MEFLTKPVKIDTGKVIINLRLLLNERYHNLIIIVTDGKDTQRRAITNYPYHYKDFTKEETKIKKYIIDSLEKDSMKHSPQDVENLVKNLKYDMDNKIKAIENFPKDNNNFKDIFKNCQEENRKNSKDNNKKNISFNPSTIIREILINQYQNIIDKINNGETKELVLDCEDFNIMINAKEGKRYPLTDWLQHSPEQFKELVRKELNNLIHEKPPSLNPYEIKEDDELYYLRFKNLEETPLKYMLSDKVGKFTQSQAIVKGVYPPRPKLKIGYFECRGCMRIHEIEQTLESKLMEPSLCSECGSRSFRLIPEESKYTNERTILLTEPLDDLNTEEKPRHLLANLIGDKTFINRVNAGNKINVTGTLNSIDDKDKKTFLLNVNYIEKLEDKTITLTKKEKDYFLELSKREDILDILVNSFAPELILPYELKLGVLCYLVKSGKDKNDLDMIHILIISDPATAKTSLKEATFELTEKGILTSGTGASGVGLTGAIVKDPITNEWTLTAGAIPLANNGHCIIDEIDKMSKEDTVRTNNYMESGKDEYNKAGLNETLQGKTSILALGNPKNGRYDPYKSIQEQVNIDPSFQSRFDLIFLLQDIPDKNKDSQIISSILNTRYNNKSNNEKSQDSIRLTKEELKKYLAFARNDIKPESIDDNAREYINTYGVKARTPNDEGVLTYDMRSVRSIPKLSEAIAKLKLDNIVTLDYVENAISLQEYSFKLIGFDPVTNSIDIDRVNGNLNQEDKRERDLILKLIKDHVKDINNLDGEGIPSRILLENFQYETNKSQETYYRRLKELKNSGEVVEIGKGRNKQYKLKDTV